jgi:hypothetical protein
VRRSIRGALLFTLLATASCGAATDAEFWQHRTATTIGAWAAIVFNAFTLAVALWTLVRGPRWTIFLAAPVALFGVFVGTGALFATGRLAEPGDLTRREFPIALAGIGPFFWVIAAFVRRFAPERQRIAALVLLPIGAMHAFGFAVLAEKAVLPTPHGAPLVLLVCNGENDALFDDGSVWTWTAESHAPQRVDVGRSVDMVCGCALEAEGKVRCWDEGEHETHDVGVLHATRIAGTPDRACALGQDGTVKCWGGDEDTTAPVAGINDAVGLAVADHHACVARRGGLVSCWGIFDEGTTVSSLANVVEVAVGDAYGCARTTAGKLFCWGDGILGDGTAGKAKFPVEVLHGGVVQVAAAGAHTCARLADGGVACWGDSDGGEVGTGATALAPPSVVLTPQRVTLARPAISLVVGRWHTCARSDRTFECWGWNATDALRTGVHEECSDDLGVFSSGTCTPTPHTVTFVE